MESTHRVLFAVVTSVITLVGIGSGRNAGAQPVEWTAASGGNGHSYELVELSGSDFRWTRARDAASARVHGGIRGHLASITSQAENDFVMSIFQARFATWRPVALWIGGYQPNPNDPADQGWTWVTGEPWSYTNWASGEPNDFSVPSARESFLELWPTRSGQWNDNVDGSSISQGWYVVEYEAAIGVAFRRGDVNGDGVKDISDAIVTLTALFIGTVTLECEDAADVDDNGQLEITDPIVCLSLLFLGIGQLPPPINCGPDPTTDALDCQRHDPCRPPPIPDTRDLTWVGPKSYFPPPADQIVLAGFGINAVVDVLASGDLPITITRDIKNVGNRTVPAGYTITESVERLIFLSTASGVGWTDGPSTTHQIFSCAQVGPQLQPGQTATIVFTFPGSVCTQNPLILPVPLTQLECGMYKEVLTVDATGIVREVNEVNNEAKHFFFVPSSQPRINIVTTLNPNADPNLQIVPVRRVVVPAFNYFPPPRLQTTTTHTVVVTTIPAGGAFIVRGRTPVIGNLADVGNLVPPPPIGVLPAGVIGPIVIDYNITFDTLFVGPNIVGSGLFYEENLDTKITVITTDGCQIRQESLLVTVLHEER